jgi:hypothetical protein
MSYLRYSDSIPHRKPHTQLWLVPLTGNPGISPTGTALQAAEKHYQ